MSTTVYDRKMRRPRYAVPRYYASWQWDMGVDTVVRSGLKAAHAQALAAALERVG